MTRWCSSFRFCLPWIRVLGRMLLLVAVRFLVLADEFLDAGLPFLPLLVGLSTTFGLLGRERSNFRSGGRTPRPAWQRPGAARASRHGLTRRHPVPRVRGPAVHVGPVPEHAVRV